MEYRRGRERGDPQSQRDDDNRSSRSPSPKPVVHAYIGRATIHPDPGSIKITEDNLAIVVRRSTMGRRSEHFLVCILPNICIAHDATVYILQDDDFQHLLDLAKTTTTVSRATDCYGWVVPHAKSCRPITRAIIKDFDYRPDATMGGDGGKSVALTNVDYLEEDEDSEVNSDSEMQEGHGQVVGQAKFDHYSIYGYVSSLPEDMFKSDDLDKVQDEFEFIGSGSIRPSRLPTLSELLDHAYHLNHLEHVIWPEDCWVDLESNRLQVDHDLSDEDRIQVEAGRSDAFGLIKRASKIVARYR